MNVCVCLYKCVCVCAREHFASSYSCCCFRDFIQARKREDEKTKNDSNKCADAEIKDSIEKSYTHIHTCTCTQHHIHEVHHNFNEVPSFIFCFVFRFWHNVHNKFLMRHINLMSCRMSLWFSFISICFYFTFWVMLFGFSLSFSLVRSVCQSCLIFNACVH